jgi:hypothetical protein
MLKAISATNHYRGSSPDREITVRPSDSISGSDMHEDSHRFHAGADFAVLAGINTLQRLIERIVSQKARVLSLSNSWAVKLVNDSGTQDYGVQSTVEPIAEGLRSSTSSRHLLTSSSIHVFRVLPSLSEMIV